MKKGFKQKSREHWLQTSESEASSRRYGRIDTVSYRFDCAVCPSEGESYIKSCMILLIFSCPLKQLIQMGKDSFCCSLMHNKYWLINYPAVLWKVTGSNIYSLFYQVAGGSTWELPSTS